MHKLSQWEELYTKMTPLTEKVSRSLKLRINSTQEEDFVVTLYPEGTIGIRPKGRRSGSEVHVPLMVVYNQALLHEAKLARPVRQLRQAKRGLLR